MATRDAIKIWDFEPHIPLEDRPSDDPDTWNWRVAQQKAEVFRRDQAESAIFLGNGLYRYKGMPGVELGSGRYQLDPVYIPHSDGFSYRGQGEGQTTVEYKANQAFVTTHRTSNVHLTGFTLEGKLQENGGLFFAHERGDDTIKTGNGFGIDIQNIEIRNMHRGLNIAGNQMLDYVHMEHVKMVEVFDPWTMNNDQHVNLSWRKGETIWGVREDSFYAPLSSWNGGKGVSKFDGAVTKVKRGGQIIFDTISFIHCGTHLYFIEPTIDIISDNTVQNLSYGMMNCRAEMRWHESITPRDGYGQLKHTVVRTNNPYPNSLTGIRPYIWADGGTQWNCQYGPVDLFHLSNRMTIALDKCRISAPNNARMIQLINPRSGTEYGIFDSRSTNVIPTPRRVSGAVAPTINHKIRQDTLGFF